MARKDFINPTNPYHYFLHCMGGKWKMTILHEIYTHGSIHFNQTLKVLPLSEKVLSQQLKELISDGLVLTLTRRYPVAGLAVMLTVSPSCAVYLLSVSVPPPLGLTLVVRLYVILEKLSDMDTSCDGIENVHLFVPALVKVTPLHTGVLAV